MKLHVLQAARSEPQAAAGRLLRSSWADRARLPVRLLHLPSHTVYEHSVEFTVDKPAPFAVQVERLLPSRWILRDDPFDGLARFVQLKNLVPITMRPLGVPTLPGIEKNWELRLRLFVEVLDDDTRPLGRPVFADQFTDEGSLGLPADSLGAFTVGAVDVEGTPFAASIHGPAGLHAAGRQATGSLGVRRPGGLLPEGSNPAYGSSLATMFSAGLAASMVSKWPVAGTGCRDAAAAGVQDRASAAAAVGIAWVA